MEFAAMISRPISAASRDGCQSSWVRYSRGRRCGAGLRWQSQAPTHAQRRYLPHFLHLVHTSVAAHATHACREMSLVVEIGVFGNFVDADPRNRLVRRGAFSNLRQQLALLANPLVAIHAGIGGRDGRVGGAFDRRVAIAAIHAEVAGMELVRKRDRLFGLVSRVRHLGTTQVCQQRNTPDDESESQGKADSQVAGRKSWKKFGP